MKRRRPILNLLVLCLLVTSLFPAINGNFAITLAANRNLVANRNLPTVPPAGLASISTRDLRRHLSFLASPELGGRFTFSPGNRIAARYLASQLESYGFRGAASDHSFFQRISFSTNWLEEKESKLKVFNSPKNGAAEFEFGDDFFMYNAKTTRLEGSIVFLGYGICSPTQGVDDYKDLDVTDKLVLITATLPPALKDKLKETEYGVAAAQAHGAKGVLVLPPDNYSPTWPLYNSVFNEENLTMDRDQPPSVISVEPKMIPRVELGAKTAQAILGVDDSAFGAMLAQIYRGDAIKPINLPTSLQLKVTLKEQQEETCNVAGILEGTDPKLKKEYLMISAHYDHLKSGPGNIFCGADDDGSGTSAVLALAQALALSPPKRSILIVFHTGEELGLYGSRYFTQYEPLVPLDTIVTDLNIDMIGRSRANNLPANQDKELTNKDSVYLIGSDKHSTELHQLSEHTNQELIGMHLDYTYNDENHPLRLFYRSDHYNYAKNGIPVIFYFTGIHSDYHRTTDTIEKIDFDKMSRITRLVYATAWRVANLPHRPVVDKWRKPAANAANANN